eukprot:146509_1
MAEQQLTDPVMYLLKQCSFWVLDLVFVSTILFQDNDALCAKVDNTEITKLETIANGYSREIEKELPYAVPDTVNHIIMKKLLDTAPLTFVFPSLPYSDAVSESYLKYFELFQINGIIDSTDIFSLFEPMFNKVQVGKLEGGGTFVAIIPKLIHKPTLTFNLKRLSEVSIGYNVMISFQPKMYYPEADDPVYLFVRNVSTKKKFDFVCFKRTMNDVNYEFGSFWTLNPEADDEKCSRIVSAYEPWDRWL